MHEVMFHARELREENVLYVTTPVRLPLQGADLDLAVELHGEKHSKLAAARAAGRRGDLKAKHSFWERCKQINRELRRLHERRAKV